MLVTMSRYTVRPGGLLWELSVSTLEDVGDPVLVRRTTQVTGTVSGKD